MDMPLSNQFRVDGRLILLFAEGLCCYAAKKKPMQRINKIKYRGALP
jgi:hypothetical protein